VPLEVLTASDEARFRNAHSRALWESPEEHVRAILGRPDEVPDERLFFICKHVALVAKLGGRESSLLSSLDQTHPNQIAVGSPCRIGMPRNVVRIGKLPYP
jgi:hypothetical protein